MIVKHVFFLLTHDFYSFHSENSPFKRMLALRLFATMRNHFSNSTSINE